MARTAARSFRPASRRLIERFAALEDGAAELVVSDHTVKTHVARILSKLDLSDRTQAVIAAYESGLVRPGTISAD